MCGGFKGAAVALAGSDCRGPAQWHGPVAEHPFPAVRCLLKPLVRRSGWSSEVRMRTHGLLGALRSSASTGPAGRADTGTHRAVTALRAPQQDRCNTGQAERRSWKLASPFPRRTRATRCGTRAACCASCLLRTVRMGRTQWLCPSGIIVRLGRTALMGAHTDWRHGSLETNRWQPRCEGRRHRHRRRQAGVADGPEGV